MNFDALMTKGRSKLGFIRKIPVSTDCSVGTNAMKKVLTGLLALSWILTASPSIAADPVNIAKLKQTKKCNKCDLRGAKLNGANLQGVEMWYADLRGANLIGANLRGADLLGADLRGTKLTGANLSRANLLNAKLNGASLKNANLNGAELGDAILRDAQLEGAKIGAAKFCRTTMPDGKIRSDSCKK